MPRRVPIGTTQRRDLLFYRSNATQIFWSQDQNIEVSFTVLSAPGPSTQLRGVSLEGRPSLARFLPRLCPSASALGHVFLFATGALRIETSEHSQAFACQGKAFRPLEESRLDQVQSMWRTDLLRSRAKHLDDVRQGWGLDSELGAKLRQSWLSVEFRATDTVHRDIDEHSGSSRTDPSIFGQKHMQQRIDARELIANFGLPVI